MGDAKQESLLTDNKDLRAIRDSVAWVGRLSDGLLRVGPFSLGLDGVLTWIPGLGEVYSVTAAAFILVQGARAGVPAPTLVLCGALMGGRTVISAIPGVGSVLADILTTHKWSARLIVAAIDARLLDRGADGPAYPASRMDLARA